MRNIMRLSVRQPGFDRRPKPLDNRPVPHRIRSLLRHDVSQLPQSLLERSGDFPQALQPLLAVPEHRITPLEVVPNPGHNTEKGAEIAD